MCLYGQIVINLIINIVCNVYQRTRLTNNYNAVLLIRICSSVEAATVLYFKWPRFPHSQKPMVLLQWQVLRPDCRDLCTGCRDQSMVSVPFLSRLLIASCLYSKSWISRFVWDRLTVTNIIREPPAFRGRLQIYYSHSAICLRLFIPNILLQIPTRCFCAGLVDWTFSSWCSKRELRLTHSRNNN